MVTKGTTALGPGLLISLALSSKAKAGSTVIVCTDGATNTGLGKLEGGLFSFGGK